MCLPVLVHKLANKENDKMQGDVPVLHYTLRMRKLIVRKNTDCFPLWNTIANHGAQYPISSFKADRPAIYKTSRICRHSDMYPLSWTHKSKY